MWVYIISFVLAAAGLAGLWKTFLKLGEKGWKGIIPVYNYYVLLRAGGHSGWWIVAYFVPAIVLVVAANFVSPGVAGADPGALVEVLASIVLLSVIAITVVQTVVHYDVARFFGKGIGLTIGLTIVSPIIWPIIGFSKMQPVNTTDEEASAEEGDDTIEDNPHEEEKDDNKEDTEEDDDGEDGDEEDNHEG